MIDSVKRFGEVLEYSTGQATIVRGVEDLIRKLRGGVTIDDFNLNPNWLGEIKLFSVIYA